MPDQTKRFERQMAWQQARRALSWPVKIKMVEALRESILALRRGRTNAEIREDRGPTGRPPISDHSTDR